MSTGLGVNQGKTKFVEDQLRRDDRANEESINEAWAAAGKDGSISGSLVSKTRSKLGLTNKRAPYGSKSGSGSYASASKGYNKPGPKPGSKMNKMTSRPMSDPAPSSRSAPPAPEPARYSAPKGQSQMLDKLESEIDDMMWTLKQHGGLKDVESALRNARRLLSRYDD